MRGYCHVDALNNKLFLCEKFKYSVMEQSSMKEDYFEKLRNISKKIDELVEPDRDKMNSILYQAEDIVGVFNQQRSNYPNSRKELLLEQNELEKLRAIIKEIWKKSEDRNLVPRPEPDINFKNLQS